MRVLVIFLALSVIGAAETRIAFGSCNNHNKPQPLWDPISEAQPDLFLWLGDIVYNDTDDPAVMAKKYGAQRAVPGYAALRKQCMVK